VFAVTLGCPKNRVDTEVMLGDLLMHGYVLVDEPDGADVLLVNTCGFLAEARRESLDTLRELATRLRPGARLVAAGCMSGLFRKTIEAEVPEAEVLVGVRDLLALRGRLAGDATSSPGQASASNPRLVTTPAGYAYLKIADGCNRRCAFCIIPRIRGRQHSRQPDDLIAEARGLASTGVRELVLVAQDLTAYGTDLPSQPSLAGLVSRLGDEVPGIEWIRLMYLYPRGLDDALLDVMEQHPRCLKYLDIPVQHGDDRVLRAMRRGTSSRDLLRMVERIRSRVPGVVLRTTYLVGFPGETDESFDNLMKFAAETRFEMAGVFRFSPEPGSMAASLPDPVPAMVQRDRVKRLETLLAELAARTRDAWIGTVHPAVVENPGSRRTESVGRLWFQAPEVDGVVRIGVTEVKQGRIVPVRVTGYQGADFLAERVL
jgi:ribosomal protein S12 methylthiotransferase